MTPNAAGVDDPLTGVLAPTITAFNADESVNEERTARHARFAIDRGADAVFPLGPNGEFALLTPEERDLVVEAVVEELDGDAPVVAGVGAAGTHETVQHAVHAEEVGADAVAVVTPYYHPLDGQAALDHYRRVADAVDLPIYVYHDPLRTGTALSPETITRVAAIETVAGLIDAGEDIALLGKVVDAHPELPVVAGAGDLLVPGLDAGCSGVGPAVAGAFPELVADLYEAHAAGDGERARELQSEVYDVRNALERAPPGAGVKAALDRRGFETGPVRSPLRNADPEALAAIGSELDELGRL